MLFGFIQSSFFGEEALRTEERKTLWNPKADVGVATVEKYSINEGIAQYSLTTQLDREC